MIMGTAVQRWLARSSTGNFTSHRGGCDKFHLLLQVHPAVIGYQELALLSESGRRDINHVTYREPIGLQNMGK